jgi:hypothetical protein
MGFDVTQNAAILAALQARCDQTFPMTGGKFVFASEPTMRTLGDSLFQNAILPQTQERTAIAWSAVYRIKVLVGTLLVCDTSMLALATAMMLQEATDALNIVDMKLLTQGSPEALYPSTAPGFH